MWTPSTRCPMQAALALRDALGIKTFVETGTAQGDTSFIAAGHFENIITVEINDSDYAVAKKHLERVKVHHHPFGPITNISMYHGDTLEVLPKILTAPLLSSVGNANPLGTPTLFWLDAHYSGGPTKIGKSECPVLEEIHLIRKANQKHCLIIDDMQIFDTGGKEREEKMKGWSNRPGDWPHVDDLIKAAKEDGPCYCMMKEHVLFIVPPECEQVLEDNA